MRSIIALVSLVAVVAGARTGGYEDFYCSPDPNKAFVPCDVDCVVNHGALTGKCGDMSKGDYNCYCDGKSPQGLPEKSKHCQEKDDSFRNICSLDCQCSHGGLGGYCDWPRKACVCSGSNPENKRCPAKTAKEMLTLVYNYAGDRLGPNAVHLIKTFHAGGKLPANYLHLQ